MAFGWGDFIDLAEWLAANAGTAQLAAYSDAVYRTSISRGYYGAFQLAMALLVQKGEYTPTNQGEDHGAVIRSFQRHQGRPRQQIGAQLDRLRDRRRRADYDLISFQDPASAARASVQQAKEIRRALQFQ